MPLDASDFFGETLRILRRSRSSEIPGHASKSAKVTEKALNLISNVEPKRDAYGFAVRPQNLQRYREYSDIYKEEEKERSGKWKGFLEQHVGSAQPCFPVDDIKTCHAGDAYEKEESLAEKVNEGNNLRDEKPHHEVPTEGNVENVVVAGEKKSSKAQRWASLRPSLGAIEKMMSLRIKHRNRTKDETLNQNHLSSTEEGRSLGGGTENDSEEEYYEEVLHESMDAFNQESGFGGEFVSPDPSFPWKELEFLVHGGVPRGLRGEVWQAFVGVETRRVEKYYQDMLAPETIHEDFSYHDTSLPGNYNINPRADNVAVPEKWRKQIEKDLPRTFPGHPALDEDGRDSLRRVLLAYARHNPTVGYCQAMNFFAGLLLLMMPEENAFWTLVGIIDDYFDGYYSEEMTESQVDQLVFEELMRERFPKLVAHLDYLGVEVAWLSGPWFLTIFVNILPWESVLRIWDVILFEGNRVMIFRTALALMDLYGPALVTTKDAGDAVTLLQSLAGSTFDSSQLVLTACMGFMAVTESRLQELREKHRPSVLEAAEERKSGGQVKKGTKGLASKLYSFKHDPEALVIESSPKEGLGTSRDGDMPTDLEKFLSGVAVNSEADTVPDLQDQVVWLKVEMCRLLEEKRSATMRAEELEMALMEMVKLDNRRELSAKVERLEQEVAELRQTISDKREQETAMLQVLMRVEQEQRLTEDARLCAEQDAAAQKYAVHVLQEKYEKAMASVAQMEKRVVMAESLLEATLQYESGQVKAQSSPRSIRQDAAQPTRVKALLSMPFALGWRDRNKGKPADVDETGDRNSFNERADSSTSGGNISSHQVHE